MKITPSFVLALAAASSVSASPLFKRQGDSSSSASNGLPTPSAASSASSAFSSATASRVSSTASSTATGTSASGSGSSNSSGTTQKFNDTQILQYALTLEHLEATFYNQSLSKLSASDFEQAGYNSTVRDQIYSIGRDEAAHVELLTKVLGNQSIPACTYNFSAVTDVESFLTTARVLEGVGVSAYLGASQNITNGTALVAAASILTVEGQHQSYLIAQTDDGGNAIPNPFATPLDFKQVYSLAAPFIESCPQNASLPITAFPSLTLSGGAANGSFTPGEQVTVSYDSSNSTSSNNSSSSDGSKYLAIIQGITGPQFVSLDGSSNNGTYQVTLPNNITGGQMYAVVTSSNTAVTDDNTLAGPAVGYVNIPLPEAPEATNTASSSSSSASMTSSSGSSSATGGAGGAGAAGPTDSASSAAATATASGSDSIVSSASSTGSASSASATGSSTQSLAPSLASLGSASIPSATNN